MSQRRILVAKPPAKRSLALQPNSSTSANAAFVASSTRLNTHVLLGLSMLVLSANARPLDTPGGAGNMGLAALLSGNAAEWAASSNGGIGEQIAESFLKMLHLNGGAPEKQSEDTLLSDIVKPTSPAEPAAEYPALLPGPPAAAADSAGVTWDSAEIHQEKTHMFETLMSQNPALSFALNVADLMHKMRELFVDIAVLEGEDRGIFVKEEQMGLESEKARDGPLLEQAHAGAGPSPLGLQLQAGEQTMPVFPSVLEEDDPPMFDLDDMNEPDELAIPGQFSPVKSPSAQPQHESVFTHLNPAVNPYAALALSSVLATLFVVGVVVGRHHYLSSRQGGESNVEDELERGVFPSDDDSNGGDAEKTAAQPSVAPASGDAPTEELDEKAAMEIQAVNLAEEQDVSTEQADAKEAMALLIDVANAALASAASSSASNLALEDTLGVMHPTAGTPKAIIGALELMRSEVSRTPQTHHLNLSTPRTRPSTPAPCTPPRRPQSALGLSTVVVDLDEKTGGGGGGGDSPISAASSFVSAYSHMPGGGANLSIGRAVGRQYGSLGRAAVAVAAAAGRGGSLGRAAARNGSMARVPAVRGRSALEAVFIPHEGGALSIPHHHHSTNPEASLAGSPTPSYVTAIEQPSTPILHDSRPLHAASKAGGDEFFHTPPTRATSPTNDYYPQHPGALMLFDDPDYEGALYRHDGAGPEGASPLEATAGSSSMQTRHAAMFPPAQLTQTALELALMLPATEWIFQFIVVFIGWFGFMMRPVPTQRSGTRRL